jgi:minor extracellular serine protease Vpr
VQFAGLAPGFAGVYQVNFRVPANPPSGSQDVAISVGSATSPTVRAPVR